MRFGCFNTLTHPFKNNYRGSFEPSPLFPPWLTDLFRNLKACARKVWRAGATAPASVFARLRGESGAADRARKTVGLYAAPGWKITNVKPRPVAIIREGDPGGRIQEAVGAVNGSPWSLPRSAGQGAQRS
jgi:hypothetical protein